MYIVLLVALFSYCMFLTIGGGIAPEVRIAQFCMISVSHLIHSLLGADRKVFGRNMQMMHDHGLIMIQS